MSISTIQRDSSLPCGLSCRCGGGVAEFLNPLAHIIHTHLSPFTLSLAGPCQYFLLDAIKYIQEIHGLAFGKFNSTNPNRGTSSMVGYMSLKTKFNKNCSKYKLYCTLRIFNLKNWHLLLFKATTYVH